MAEIESSVSARTEPSAFAAEDGASASTQVDVFLCHNSLDKPFVRQVAEGFELEFGIPHFLDVYAIPTGEAFLPWIDRALATSTGCAIFLGANGWGNTHFWEAERALDRYRKDPKFRLIPVALPGIRPQDMGKLGSGSVFSEINWADLRNGAVDTDAISKLRAALLGRTVESSTKGPSRLTPYMVRRDAGRWDAEARKNRSILYRGRQLAEAERLRVEQPDLVAGDAVLAFLSASARTQTARWRWLTGAAAFVALTVTMLAFWIDHERQLALSRYLASEARQAASPDTRLLLALQAIRFSTTSEAYGAIAEQLDAQPHLRHVLRLAPSEVLSLAFNAAGSAVYAGQANGKITRIDLKTRASTEISDPAVGGVTALEIDPENGDIWAGTESGRLFVVGGDGRFEEVSAIIARDLDRIEGARRGQPILSLQIDPGRHWVAVGDHQHRLALVGRVDRTIAWQHEFTGQRIRSVSFNAQADAVAAATSDGAIEILRLSDGRVVGTRTTARTGNPMAMQFSRAGDLRVIDDGGLLSVFAAGAASPIERRLADGGLTAAVVGPRREFGPITRRDLALLGLGSGDVALTPANSAGEALTVVGAHARLVYSVAMSADGRFAASGAADGSVAIWDLARRSRLIAPLGVPGGQIAALTFAGPDGVASLATSVDGASIQVHSGDGWRQVQDLMALSVQAAGAASVAAPASVADARGFRPVASDVVVQAVFSKDARHLAWVTRAGAVLLSPFPVTGTPRVLRGSGLLPDAIAVDDAGQAVFVADALDLARYPAERPDGEAPQTRRLKAPARYILAGPDGFTADVATENSVERVRFQGETVPATSFPLPITAGQLARATGGGLLASGAGSSAGIDVGRVDGGRFRRLHSRRLEGAVSAIAVSAATATIVAGDHDGKLHLWDVDTLLPIASFRASGSAIMGLAVSPNDKQLAVWDAGGDVFQVSLDRDQWVREACDIAMRELTADEWNALLTDTRLRAGCKEQGGR